MATTNTISTLDGMFKECYADSVSNLLPDFSLLSKMVKFKESERIGEGYAVPVKLQYEAGFTYGASGDGAFALNNSVAGKIGKAIVNSAQIVLRSQMDYESAFKAASKGKAAFGDATQALVENMVESFAKRLEIAFLYGGTGLGQNSAVSDNSGTCVCTISDATWAPGIWVGMVGAELDAYTSTSKQNSNAALTISKVDIANKQITVTGNSSDTAAIDNNSVLYFRGAYGKELNGIDKILTNSGSLYGLSAATYELWKSTSYAVSAAISMEKVLLGAAKATVLGLKEDAVLLISPAKWAVLNNDLAALRRTDSSYSNLKVEVGHSGITYYGVNGKMDIVAHPFVKEGEAFLLPVKRLKRVGSTDTTFQRPGNPNSFFREIDGYAGFELRAFCDQQMFLEAPGMAVKFTSIS